MFSPTSFLFFPAFLLSSLSLCFLLSSLISSKTPFILLSFSSFAASFEIFSNSATWRRRSREVVRTESEVERRDWAVVYAEGVRGRENVRCSSKSVTKRLKPHWTASNVRSGDISEGAIDLLSKSYAPVTSTMWVLILALRSRIVLSLSVPSESSGKALTPLTRVVIVSRVSIACDFLDLAMS